MWFSCCLSQEAPTPSEKEPPPKSYVSQQYFSRSQPTIAKPQDSVELPPSSQRCELRLPPPPPPPPPSPSPPPQALPAGPIPAHLVFFTDKPTLKDDIVINVSEYGMAIKGDRVVLGAELDLQFCNDWIKILHEHSETFKKKCFCDDTSVLELNHSYPPKLGSKSPEPESEEDIEASSSGQINSLVWQDIHVRRTTESTSTRALRLDPPHTPPLELPELPLELPFEAPPTPPSTPSRGPPRDFHER